jgi:mono/diheme cytochrome c family protein
VELKNPLDPKAANERGVLVYQNFCTPCHGPTMGGDGAVALRGYPAPPNLRGEKSMTLAEGQMFHILTFGQKNMPSHASQLSVDDRWSVISYVRALQQEAKK